VNKKMVMVPFSILKYYLGFYVLVNSLMFFSSVYFCITHKVTVVSDISEIVVIWLIFPVFAALGVFFYLSEKKWLPRINWKIFFFLFIAIQIFELFIINQKSAEYDDSFTIVMWLVYIYFNFPITVGVFLFSFEMKSRLGVWKP
jgi:hypothetical protein